MDKEIEMFAEEYASKRSGITDSIKSAFTDDTVYKASLLAGAGMAMAMMASACYGAHIESQILVDHGLAALQSYRENDVPFPVDQKSFGYMIEHVKNNGLSPRAGMIAGAFGALAAVTSMGSAKIVKALVRSDESLPSNFHVQDQAKKMLLSPKTSDVNLVKRLDQYRQFGFLDRIRAENETPGISKLFKLTNSVADRLVSDGEDDSFLTKKEAISNVLSDLEEYNQWFNQNEKSQADESDWGSDMATA